MNFARQIFLLLLTFVLGFWVHGHFWPSAPTNTALTAPVSPPAAANSGTVTASEMQPLTGNADELLAGASGFADATDATIFLRQRLATTSLERLQAISTELALLPPGRKHAELALSSAVRIMLQQNPAAAVQWAQSLPDHSSELLHKVWTAWALVDAAAALDAARKLPDAKARSTARNAIAESLAEVDPAKAFALVANDASQDAQEVAQNILLTWKETNPRAAFAAAMSLPKGNERTTALHEIYSEWARQDSTAAIASLARLSPVERQGAWGQIYDGWAQRDPMAAWQHCQKLPLGDPLRTNQTIILQVVAQKNPTQALSLLDGVSPQERLQGMATILPHWAKADVSAALAYTAALTNPKEREIAVGSFGENLNLAEPGKFEQLMTQFPKPSEQRSLVINFISTNEGNHTDQCLEVLSKMSPSQQRQVIGATSLVAYLGQENPDQAIQLLRNFPDSGMTGQWITMARTLAETDPARAYQVLLDLPPSMQQEALPSYLQELAGRNVKDALAKATALPEGQTKQDCLTQIMGAWAQENPVEVIDMAGKLDGDLRKQASVDAINVLAAEDATGALSAWEKLSQSKHDQDRSAATESSSILAAALYNHDPAAAAKWAEQLPEDSSVRTIAMQSLAQHWIVDDPEAASAWIKQLPNGEPKDAAVQALTRGIAPSDPESAYIWATSTKNEAMRNALITDVLRVWLKNDPTAGEKALMKSPLSTEERDALREESR